MKHRSILGPALAIALLACDQTAAPVPATPGDFDHPQAVVFAGDLLVVANSGYRPDGWGPGSLTVVDPARAEVLHRLPTSEKNPQTLVVRGDAVYAVASGIIDLTDFDRPRAGTGGAVDVFPVAALTGADGPAFSHPLPVHADDDRIGAPVDLAFRQNRAVLTSALADVAWVLDTARGTWLRGPADPVRLGGEAISLGLGSVRPWSGGFALVDFNTDRLMLLDAAGLPTGCAVDLGAHPDLLEGMGSPLVVDDVLYALGGHAGTIRAVDLTDLAPDCDAPVRTVVDGLGQTPNDLDWHDGRLVVVLSGDNVVEAYDPQTGQRTQRWLLPVGSNPWHAAFDDAGRWMAVTEWASHAVSLFDLQTGEVRRISGIELPAPVPLPDGPTRGAPTAAEVLVDAPETDGGRFRDPTLAVNGVRGGGPGAGSVDVFSLRPGEHLTIRWPGRRVVDGPGADFAVFENGFAHPGGVFFDPIVLELSRDGSTWFTWPHRVVGPPEDPASWSGFAGLTPVSLHAEHNPVDPFSPAAGGDAFDLAALPDEGEAGRIRREGFVYLRLSPAQGRIDPDTGAPFAVDPISDGPDIDGVVARFFDDE